MKSMHDIITEEEAAKPEHERRQLPTKLTIAIPANIRFQFYETREAIVLENKFASSSAELPLVKGMDYGAMKQATNQMKRGMAEIYATYAGAVLGGLLAPFAVSN